MSDISEIVQLKVCTGCSACTIACPVEAISMKSDAEGFLVPEIDRNKCRNCSLCISRCHLRRNFEERAPEGRLILSNDARLRARSASGGAFSALATLFLQNGGVVYGAAFDECLHTKHIRVSDAVDLWRLQGSKYVQSELADALLELLKDVSSGVPVLFSGTPCQVAGVSSLFNEEPANLYTVDLVCHGVPSPAFWDDYVHSVIQVDYASEKNAAFRIKTPFERGSYALQVMSGGRIVRRPAALDLYYSLFMKGASFRESCYKCSYASLRRPGDITIGDCASVGNYEGFHDEEVLSIMLLSTEKGIKLWNRLEDSVDYAELDVELESSLNAQLNHPAKRPLIRDVIYSRLRDEGYAAVEKDIVEGLSWRERAGVAVRKAIPLKLRIKIKRVIGGKRARK